MSLFPPLPKKEGTLPMLVLSNTSIGWRGPKCVFCSNHTCRDTKSSFLYLLVLQLIDARFPHFSRFLRENLHTHIHRTEGQILASLLWVVLFQGILVQTIQNPTDLAVSGSWWNLMRIKRQHNKSVVHINWQFSHWRLTINMLCCRSSFWDWQFL